MDEPVAAAQAAAADVEQLRLRPQPEAQQRGELLAPFLLELLQRHAEKAAGGDHPCRAFADARGRSRARRRDRRARRVGAAKPLQAMVERRQPRPLDQALPPAPSGRRRHPFDLGASSGEVGFGGTQPRGGAGAFDLLFSDLGVERRQLGAGRRELGRQSLPSALVARELRSNRGQLAGEDIALPERPRHVLHQRLALLRARCRRRAEDRDGDSVTRPAARSACRPVARPPLRRTPRDRAPAADPPRGRDRPRRARRHGLPPPPPGCSERSVAAPPAASPPR